MAGHHGWKEAWPSSFPARRGTRRFLERYFAEELDQRIGNIAAGALLSFFLEEVGPLVYNQAVGQVQQRLHDRVQELDIDFNEDEFQYWRRRSQPSRPRK